jgi:hypothetical protein
MHFWMSFKEFPGPFSCTDVAIKTGRNCGQNMQRAWKGPSAIILYLK